MLGGWIVKENRNFNKGTVQSAQFFHFNAFFKILNMQFLEYYDRIAFDST